MIGQRRQATEQEFQGDCVLDIVHLEDVTKLFGEIRAVDGVRLDVQEGEILCLLGPSGCGKTTLLRMIAGFEKPTAGRVWLSGKDVTAVPPERRNTALVFQNYALFPHMTVFDNIAFGLKVRRWSMREIRSAVHEVLELVGMPGLEERWVQQLSGGQQQRVALARALVVRPSTLLLDEPLSNLDAKLRMQMRSHLKSIQRQVGITAIFVTHDQEEALTLGDRIAIMHEGKLVQLGCPREVYTCPNCTFVASFIGQSNCLQGQVEEKEGTRTLVLDSGERVSLPAEGPADGAALLVLRPEQLGLTSSDNPPQGLNALPGTVEHVNYLGEMVYYEVRLVDGTMMTVAEYGGELHGWKEGDKVWVTWPQDTGRVLTT